MHSLASVSIPISSSLTPVYLVASYGTAERSHSMEMLRTMQPSGGVLVLACAPLALHCISAVC